MVISAWDGPRAITDVGSPGSLGERGMRSQVLPSSLVWSNSVGLPRTQPSPSLNETTWNRYVTSSSASRFENDRASQVFPPSFVSANDPRAPTRYPWVGLKMAQNEQTNVQTDKGHDGGTERRVREIPKVSTKVLVAVRILVSVLVLTFVSLY